MSGPQKAVRPTDYDGLPHKDTQIHRDCTANALSYIHHASEHPQGPPLATDLYCPVDTLPPPHWQCASRSTYIAAPYSAHVVCCWATAACQSCRIQCGRGIGRTTRCLLSPAPNVLLGIAVHECICSPAVLHSSVWRSRALTIWLSNQHDYLGGTGPPLLRHCTYGNARLASSSPKGAEARTT